MAKTIDYIALCITVFLLTFVWSTVLFSDWVAALIFSLALSLLILFTVKYVGGKHNKPYDYDRLSLEFSVKGSEYLINLIKTTLENGKFESGSNYILLDDAILIAAFRFNILGIGDMSAIYQLASEHKKKKLYVMARGIDRRAYNALLLQDVTLTVIKIKPIYRYLQKHNALPKLKRERKRFSFAALSETMFRRSNTKNYIFSGVMLIAVAFLTPLKIYYLVFGSVSLLLAILTLTPLGKGEFRSAKAFEKLEQLNKFSESTSDSDSTQNDDASEDTVVNRFPQNDDASEEEIDNDSQKNNGIDSDFNHNDMSNDTEIPKPDANSKVSDLNSDTKSQINNDESKDNVDSKAKGEKTDKHASNAGGKSNDKHASNAGGEPNDKHASNNTTDNGI